MKDAIKYHETVKNEQHVFICAVSGRSSSTAFQRILNSSNEVWIWGEPHGILNQLLSLIGHTKELANNNSVKKALAAMYHSYMDNKHLSFYANAIGNLQPTIELLISSISNFLMPWAPKVKRFGFKEIDLINTEMLIYLKEIYPRSYLIFCFRDPLLQWPSISKLELLVSFSLDNFLQEYNSIATTYLKYAQKNSINAFVENTDLMDVNKVKKIIHYLKISKIDESLIGVTVHTIKPKKLSKKDTEKILQSTAYQRYLEMKNMSESFYKSSA